MIRHLSNCNQRIYDLETVNQMARWLEQYVQPEDSLEYSQRKNEFVKTSGRADRQPASMHVCLGSVFHYLFNLLVSRIVHYCLHL